MVDTPLNHHTLQDSIGFWSKIADKVGVSTMIDYAMKEEDGSPLPNWACSQLWQRLFVLADGDVVPCCSGVAGGNTKLCVLGNAYDDSISDIWVGARLEKIRELHKTGNSHKITMCAKCDLRKNQVKTTKVNIRDG
jgi:radical SAM protein with 4Fe4S-binding SPASM domain